MTGVSSIKTIQTQQPDFEAYYSDTNVARVPESEDPDFPDERVEPEVAEGKPAKRYVFLEKLAEIKASNEQQEAKSSPIKRQYFVGGYGGGFGSYGYGGGYGGHGYGGGYGGHGHGVHRRAADYPAPNPADKIQPKRQIYAAEEQQARELASRIRELEEEEVHFTCSFLEHNIRL